MMFELIRPGETRQACDAECGLPASVRTFEADGILEVGRFCKQDALAAGAVADIKRFEYAMETMGGTVETRLAGFGEREDVVPTLTVWYEGTTFEVRLPVESPQAIANSLTNALTFILTSYVHVDCDAEGEECTERCKQAREGTPA